MLMIYPLDTGRKIKVHKMLRRRPERLLNVLCTFNFTSCVQGILILEFDLKWFITVIIEFFLQYVSPFR